MSGAASPSPKPEEGGGEAGEKKVVRHTLKQKEETPSQIALKVLRAINKSSNSALQLDDVPEEFLVGEHLDMERWTLVMTDKNMRQMSEQPREYFFIDCAKPTVPEFFRESFWDVRKGANGVLSLNITGAKEVSEYGLAVFARKNPNLLNLTITGCNRIGDAGLREVGMNCPGLLTLNMSSCHAVEGSGLIAIAECCKQLLKLDVSRCKTMQKYGITKLFYECKMLEEVNLSYLPDCGDQEVRVLAQNCPNIVYFNAKESVYISDFGMQLLAANCPDLDFVDVSRTNMSYRISDLTLLALSQKSHSLRVLKLSGCDTLTDVGLTWLAEGCKVIEELDLNGCERITDAGLRSLGASCHALTSLDITTANLCSDVGIASLAMGCPNMKHLVLGGLFFLSDPRLSAPQKGQKKEVWQAVVGLQAVGDYMQKLESIDLSGCFRLCLAIQRHLSNIASLTKVNLMGCNQTTTEALVGLAEGCKNLLEINLSDCGKSVNNTSILAFAHSCLQLQTVIFCRCSGVRGGVVAALARCENLVKIDLTSCKALTDMMMLPICEADKVPKLKTLILLNCPLITDTTLAWLASKTQEVMLVAVRGTAISRHAVQAVRDRFPNSDMLQNENFLGFWPKHRIEDRKMANLYYFAKQGWIKLQARQRSWLARVRVSGIVEKRRRKKAVYKLQRMCRLFVAINRVFYKRRERERHNRKALVVTSIFRIALAKKRMFRRRMELYETYRRIMCIKLQTRWRMHWAKGIRLHRQRLRQEFLRKQQFGAIKMQSIARVYFAKNRVLRIKQLRKTQAIVRERKCIYIQKNWRGSRGRIKAKKAREYLHWKLVMRVEAAKKIQRKARINSTKRLVKKRAAYRRYRTRCAVKIQSLIRGAICRLKVAQMISEGNEFKYETAASVIQSGWRVKQARIMVKKMHQEAAELLVRQAEAAFRIQCCLRCKLARIRTNRRREAYYANLKMRAHMELWSICKIQAVFRGFRGRMKFDAEVRKRKGKWKELFDEEKQRRFFYNKTTGEIRWRMPQDLLDLIPRPACDNCTFYEATTECAVCNEVYCQQCWDQVHFGGRRRDHDFRALYDYYGKRLDYGDGVFPSKWPSEVIQDEVQGWMLRVAPIRDATAQYGNWEEYTELEPNGDVGKTFYFNRQTFEATYDVPQDVTAELQARADADAWEEYNAQQADLLALEYSSNKKFGGGGGGGVEAPGMEKRSLHQGRKRTRRRRRARRVARRMVERTRQETRSSLRLPIRSRAR